MADLEVGGLRHASSITKDAAKIVGFYTGLLGMRLVYKCMNFDDSAKYLLAYAGGASSKGRKEGSTQEVFAAVRHLGGRVAEKGALLVGGRAHV
jgi:catechol 2,3-dioxygenase-like lactoylglutathione lyase family enzyme